jgi:integrase
MAKLTKRVVDAAEAGASPYIIWDDEIKGYGLRVPPGGTKSYVLKSRRARPQRAAAASPSASTARRGRPSWRDARRCGCSEPSRRAMIPQLHARPKRDPQRCGTHAARRGSRPHRSPSAAAAAPRQARPGRTRHGSADPRVWISFAVARGLRDDNPVRGVKKPSLRRIERFLSETEIARLGEALDAEVKATNDPYPAAAIRLLLLTGCRRSEILGLRWEWIDFEREMIFLPDSRTGRKPVYLNAPALEVLERLPEQLGNPHVICGHRDGRAYAGLHKVWRRVRTAAGLPGVRLHDSRHNSGRRIIPATGAQRLYFLENRALVGPSLAE